MSHNSELVTVFFGLASAATWGVADFSGGLATRRTPVLTVALLSQIMGGVMLILLALVRAERLPSMGDAGWGCAAGLMGLFGLIAFYRAMAVGQMGVVAPVTAVLCAGLPVVVGMFTQGWPGPTRLIGFAVALAGIGVISRPPGEAGRPAGLGLAIVAGICFGGFLVCIAQVQSQAVFWPLAVARSASIAVMLVLVLAGRRVVRPGKKGLFLMALIGIMDAWGNAFFVLSEQTGRLDVAGALASLYPATTVLLALFILKERLARMQGIGVLLALVAVPLIAG